jgi:hypothetical protein
MVPHRARRLVDVENQQDRGTAVPPREEPGNRAGPAAKSMAQHCPRAVQLCLGVFWVSTRWIHDALLWLPIAYLVVLVLGIVGLWFRFRSNDRQAAG